MAVAALSTEPWSTSAWVTTYDAVQVIDFPGASVPAGQSTEPSFGSSTAMVSRVTLPALVTVNA